MSGRTEGGAKECRLRQSIGDGRILPVRWPREHLRGRTKVMKRPAKSTYPDISDILHRKAEARKERAALSFGEKIARLEALRERLAPFNRAREEREAARRQ